MKDIHYAFCVAKIRALENRLLTKKDISALIGQKNLTSARELLIQRGYAFEGESAAEITQRHSAELSAVLFESVPDKKELDALYILNDYFNLKVIVKCSAERLSADGLLLFPTTIDFTDFDPLTADGEFAFLDPRYREAASKSYAMALKSESGMYSDVIIDTAAINALSEYSARKNSGILGKICAFTADTANIRAALRCTFIKMSDDYIEQAIGKCCRLDRERLISSASEGRDALIAYLEETLYKDGVEAYLKTPSAFEKWCDDRISEIAREAVFISFGFDPVTDYYYKKNLEIKTVRMILAAIGSDVDKSAIKERVRGLYA